MEENVPSVPSTTAEISLLPQQHSKNQYVLYIKMAQISDCVFSAPVNVKLLLRQYVESTASYWISYMNGDLNWAE